MTKSRQISIQKKIIENFEAPVHLSVNLEFFIRIFQIFPYSFYLIDFLIFIIVFKGVLMQIWKPPYMFEFI